MQTTISTQSAAQGSVAPPFRWIILLCAWAALLTGMICRLSFGTLALSVGQSLALPVGSLGVFVTAFYVGYVLSNAISGVITDRIGARTALSISLISLAIGTFCFGFTNSLRFGLVIQVIMGVTAGADYAAGIKLVTSWFEKRERARAVGILMTAGAIAVMLSSAVLPTLVARYGWRYTYHGLGLCVVVLALLCALVVRESPALGGAANAPRQAKPRISALFTRNFVLLALAGCGGFWGTLGLMSWVISLLIKGHGISSVQAGFVLSVIGLAGLFSNPAIGWLSDWLGGRRKILTIVSMGAFLLMLLAFGQLSTLSSFMIAAPLLGVSAFIFAPLLVTQITEQRGPEAAGSAAGIANAFWQSGSALAPIAVGTAFQHTGSFSIAFSTLALGPLVGLICMLFVKEIPNR